MSDTGVREDVRTTPTTTDGSDRERFAHIIHGRKPGAKITEAVVTGTPITALCGKTWVPSRDASRFPVCPECKEIKARLQGA